MGYRRLVFGADGVTNHAKELYPIPLPGNLVKATIVTNQAIPYREIRWIGPIRQRQWWALLLGGLATPLGLFWMSKGVHDGLAFAIGLVWLLLLGLLPLWLFIRGRTFLAIASERAAICIPMDRKKKQVRRVIELLKVALRSRDVQWYIEEV